MQVTYADKVDTPHRRTLEMHFDNGKVVTIALDQGLGYWRLRLDRGLHNFDFERSVKDQIRRLGEAYGRATVNNSADWQTWFTVGISE